MKTIILLHGAIGAKDQLSSLSVELNRRGFNALTFDFSGHGEAPFQNQFGIKQFGNELKLFINENQLIKPTIFGYSMGGYVALYLASQHPDLLGTFITLGTKFEWSTEIAQREIKMLNPEMIIEKVPKFAQSLNTRHGARWQALLQKTSEMMTHLGSENLISNEHFVSIDNKVMIGLGDRDNMVSLQETVAVYKQLRNGAMFMLPDTKHPIESVKEDVLSEIIAGF